MATDWADIALSKPATTWALFDPDFTQANIVLSNENRTATYASGSGWQNMFLDTPYTSGQFYFEATTTIDVGGSETSGYAFGVTSRNETERSLTIQSGTLGASSDSKEIAFQTLDSTGGKSANRYEGVGTTTAVGPPPTRINTYPISPVFMFAVDFSRHYFWWGYDGSWAEDPDVVSIPVSKWVGTHSCILFGMHSVASGNFITLNTGQSAFTHTVPTGFTSGLPATNMNDV